MSSEDALREVLALLEASTQAVRELTEVMRNLPRAVETRITLDKREIARIVAASDAARRPHHPHSHRD